MARTAANADSVVLENVCQATLVVPQIGENETIYADEELLPVGDGFSGDEHDHNSEEEAANQLEDLQNQRPRRHQQHVSLNERFGVDLQKVGKMTKTWITRHYVVHNHAMYIFDKKSDHNPRHVVYLRGLFFKKIYDKGNMHGLLLYSEGDRFKARRMYHRDEQVIDTWMLYLSKHCCFYSPAEVYE